MTSVELKSPQFDMASVLILPHLKKGRALFAPARSSLVKVESDAFCFRAPLKARKTS
jgi:hypothetical protein